MRQSYSLLCSFKIIRPQYEVAQDEALKWLGRAHAQAEALKTGKPEDQAALYIKLLQRYGCQPSRVSKRGTELNDVLESDLGQMEILSPIDSEGKVFRGPAGSGFTARTELFEKMTRLRVSQLYEDEKESPEHLIHVTCTGYVAPSAVQVLVSEKSWEKRCSVTHAYHMGCYASLPTLRLADGIRSSGKKRIDIVHTELCSLHLNLVDHAPEQLVVQSLFGDGYIRYSVTDSQGLLESEEASFPCFEVVSIHEEIIPDSLDLMTWKTSEWGMRMTLAKEVPKRIAEEIPGFIKRMLAFAQVPEEVIAEKPLFAIHPGGPRIIDQLQQVLELTDEQIAHCKNVFFNFGNMSSATLPHVWQSILIDPRVPAGKWIISLAFGPGLTAFGSIMKKRC